MQPDVARNHQNPVFGRILVAVAEDRLPRLRLDYLPLDFLKVQFGHGKN
jgi:hypothetical protein